MIRHFLDVVIKKYRPSSFSSLSSSALYSSSALSSKRSTKGFSLSVRYPSSSSTMLIENDVLISSSCGYGTESRTRRYNDKGRAMAANCQQVLLESRECESICGELYDARFLPIGELKVFKPQCPFFCHIALKYFVLPKIRCMVTDWGHWSDCSASCGSGLRMRSRKYAKEGMLDVSMCKEMLVEKQVCLSLLGLADSIQFVARITHMYVRASRYWALFI